MKNLLLVTSVIAVVSFPQTARQPVKGVVKTNSAAASQVTKRTEQDNESPESITVRGILAVITKIQEEYTQQVKAAESKANQDADINRNIERYTLGLVIVGFIQALILAGTVWAVVHQANTSKNSERAWLVVIDVGMPHGLTKMKDGSVIQGFGFEWVVKNCGKTPAFITKIGARFHCVQNLSELPEKPNIDVDGLVQSTENYFGGLSLVPGEIIQRFTMAPRDRKYATPDDLWFVYGIIEYKTIFSNRRIRETRFCYRWPAGSQEELVRSPNPPGYTKQS